MLNHIVIMGRLTRDPELRYTSANIPVASFSVAVDRDFGRGENGERQTDFINCVAWRQTGEFVSKYFQKGSMIVVSGRLQIRDYTDRDGNKRSAAEVVADNVYFGESKRRDDNGYQQGGYQPNGGSYAPDNGGYRQGGYTSNGGSFQSGAASNRDSFENARSKASSFEEVDDADGELPF